MTNNKKLKLVTHNGSFHGDDVFACATLILYLEKNNKEFSAQGGPASGWEVFRTRDPEIIENGEYVFDVGGIYDEEKNRFDHHQKGGAGKRGNGIEYSSFGLVWKKFGIEICESQKIFDTVDRKLVSPIDADDNGIDLYKNNFENVLPYTINDVLSIFSKTALEDIDKDEQFFKAVVWAKEILSREIKRTSDQIEITKIIQDFYKNSQDKRLVVIDKPKVSRHEIYDALQDFPEPLFIVYGDSEDWGVVAMRKEINSFKNRKDFPQNWGGLREEELQKITGVSDAVFCHRALFLAVAKTKEGAIKLAEIAVE
ncbi:MAG: MYG1 family protein [Candidatus Paceibacterota bacterium]